MPKTNSISPRFTVILEKSLKVEFSSYKFDFLFHVEKLVWNTIQNFKRYEIIKNLISDDFLKVQENTMSVTGKPPMVPPFQRLLGRFRTLIMMSPRCRVIVTSFRTAQSLSRLISFSHRYHFYKSQTSE